MRKVLALLLLLAGCEGRETRTADLTGGAKLEAAAVAAGLVPDPERASLVGSWARDTDRVCVVPGGTGAARIGVLIDYGDGNGCAGSGTVTRSADRLEIVMGGCRVNARFDGERIIFPPSIGAACERLCRGNATLAALSADRVSQSAAEAATLRTPSGRSLCAG